MKILFIFGTRPEAIKMAPVVKEARNRNLDTVVCATSQHREMLRQALTIFDIEPDIDLDLMRDGQTLSGLTARAVQALDEVVTRAAPDWVLVQGDTTSAMAGALVSFYHQVKVGHIEAGLRTGDMLRPFPEEFNRRAIDLIADKYFAPTRLTANNLLREGISEDKVHITGNTVIDALIEIAKKPCNWNDDSLRTLDPDRPIVLITAHRRESFGAPFRNLCEAIRDLSTRFPGYQFVYPVHLNPNVREPVREILSDLPNVKLLEPVGYLTFVQLLKHSCLVLTDSGGVQEEAPTFGAPVLVMRDTTERPEGIAAGVARLVGTSRENIVQAAERALTGEPEESQLHTANPYGDGKASIRIVDTLIDADSSTENQREISDTKKTAFRSPPSFAAARNARRSHRIHGA